MSEMTCQGCSEKYVVLDTCEQDPNGDPRANLSSCLNFPGLSGPMRILSCRELSYLVHLWV